MTTNHTTTTKAEHPYMAVVDLQYQRCKRLQKCNKAQFYSKNNVAEKGRNT
jgi:hypothetical protein